MSALQKETIQADSVLRKLLDTSERLGRAGWVGGSIKWAVDKLKIDRENLEIEERQIKASGQLRIIEKDRQTFAHVRNQIEAELRKGEAESVINSVESWNQTAKQIAKERERMLGLQQIRGEHGELTQEEADYFREVLVGLNAQQTAQANLINQLHEFQSAASDEEAKGWIADIGKDGTLVQGIKEADEAIERFALKIRQLNAAGELTERENARIMGAINQLHARKIDLMGQERDRQRELVIAQRESLQAAREERTLREQERAAARQDMAAKIIAAGNQGGGGQGQAAAAAAQRRGGFIGALGGFIGGQQGFQFAGGNLGGPGQGGGGADDDMQREAAKIAKRDMIARRKAIDAAFLQAMKDEADAAGNMAAIGAAQDPAVLAERRRMLRKDRANAIKANREGEGAGRDAALIGLQRDAANAVIDNAQQQGKLNADMADLQKEVINQLANAKQDLAALQQAIATMKGIARQNPRLAAQGALRN